MAQAAQCCCWACWRHREGCQRQSGRPAWRGRVRLPPCIVIRITENCRFCLLTWHRANTKFSYVNMFLTCKFTWASLWSGLPPRCQQTRASEWDGWSSSSPSGTSSGPWWCQPGRRWSRYWRVMGRVLPSGRRRRWWSQLAMTLSCRSVCCHCKIIINYYTNTHYKGIG